MFSSSITGLIKRMAKNGQALHVNKALDLIERLNAQQAKPVITSRSAIWKLREVVREVVVKQQEAQSKEDETYQYKGFKVVLCYKDDRLRITHESKPERSVIDEIKSFGFKWSRYNVAWQRKLTNNAIYATFKLMLKDLNTI